MDELKQRVYELYNNESNLSLLQYNKLIEDCVANYEMAAVVFIYDKMKEKGINPDKNTYNFINKLHSKTVKECNEIHIKNQNVGKLQPRRRIHKIMKGYNYSDNYQNALVHLNKVKEYLNCNEEVKRFPRIKLAKNIEKNCKISFNDARYIITNLKRTKFLCDSPKKLDDFTKISKTYNSSSNSVLKQNSITNFFSKTS